MNITVIGRGNVGGGLAGRWRKAGHEVQELGKDGGDASNAHAVLVAVPSGVIGDALGNNARALEEFLAPFFAYGQGFYKFWKPA